MSTNKGTPIDFAMEDTLNFTSVRFNREEFDEIISEHNKYTHPNRLPIAISKGMCTLIIVTCNDFFKLWQVQFTTLLLDMLA